MKLAALILMLSMSARASTYYIDFSTGSDSNNGLSTNAPWQHHPFMTGWTGSYTHSSGDQFIFKGGVTWPGGCFPLVTSYGGTSGTPDYYGTNATWYAGSSWSKPIWDDSGNPLNTMTLSGDALALFEGNYVTLDSIVITNLNWSANVSVYGVNLFTSSGIVITNCEFRSFTATSPGQDNLICVVGYTGAEVAGDKVSHCIFTGLPSASTTGYCGYAAYYVETFEYNNVGWMPNGLVGVCTTNQYNVVHDIQVSMQSGVHENCLYQMIKEDGVSYCHHNIVTNNSCGLLIYLSLLGVPAGHTGTVYCYDNLIAINTAAVPAITLDPENSGQGTRGTCYCWNNTIQDAESPSYGFIRVAHRPSADWGIVVGENNHFITEGRAGVVPDIGSLATITTDFSLTNNNATANADGYTQANNWQPASASAPTVGAGTNAPSAIFNDDLLNNPRPYTGWDIGAYQYQAPGPAVIGYLTNGAGGGTNIIGYSPNGSIIAP